MNMFNLMQRATHCALIAGLAFGAASAIANPVLTFEGGGPFQAGDTVNVQVVVADLPATQVVAAYDLDVTYDSGLLSFFDVFFSLQLGDSSALPWPGAIESKAGPHTALGLVDFASTSLLGDDDLYALQLGGPVTLATLQFTAKSAGDTSSLTFANLGLDVLGGTFNEVIGRSNEVLIGQVPEPASFGLAAIALAGMLTPGALRRRRRRGAEA
jgi:hypothetical protein